MYAGRKNAAVNAKCPYYQSESRKSITCEGIYANTETVTRFMEEKEKDAHIERCCMKYPNGCSLCREIEEKYIGKTEKDLFRRE
jgi:hypothetical protein